MIEVYRKEFIVFVDPTLEILHFGALPSVGRYFTKACTRLDQGVFRVEVEVPGGFLYYHFYYDDNPQNVILDASNTQIGAKNWHSICKVGTEMLLPIRFLPRPPYVFAADEEHYGLKLHAMHRWVQEIVLEVYADDHLIFSANIPMIFRKEDHRYFEARVRREEVLRGERYTLRIAGQDTTYYLSAQSLFLKERQVERFYPVADLALLLPEPCEHHLAVYHIFPDRFARAAESASERAALCRWGEPPTREAFFGGNLAGIQEKLPYLLHLNISALYLTPIFQAPSNHRYDCIDYTSLDPLLGTAEDLRALVAACHQRGVRVILDIVLNHCGIDFFAFQDVLRYQERSAYKDWFLIHRFPVSVDALPLTYRCWWNNARMPEFQMQNPAVRQHLLDALIYWVEEFGIDGWRIDVSSEMDLSFLEEIRAALRAIRPDILLIGENWKDASLFLDGSQALDGTTNYLYWWKAFVPYFVDQTLSASEFLFQIMDIYCTYSHASILRSWNILSSHDIPRFFTLLPEKESIFLACFLQVTLPGTPVIYYGEELGLEGLDDPLNRACMPWEEATRACTLRDWYTQLLAIYQMEPAINHGYLAILACEDDPPLLIYQRYLECEMVVCIVNLSGQERTLDVRDLPLAAPASFSHLLSHQPVDDRVLVPARRGVLLKPRKQDGGI